MGCAQLSRMSRTLLPGGPEAKTGLCTHIQCADFSLTAIWPPLVLADATGMVAAHHSVPPIDKFSRSRYRTVA